MGAVLSAKSAVVLVMRWAMRGLASAGRPWGLFLSVLRGE